jgi:hypothetical protein
MTIKRPMLPPRADEHCQIIQFSAARPSAKRLDKINASPGAIVASLPQKTPRDARREAHQLMPPATETCRNHRLRLARRDAWWAARRLTEYWRARLDWNSALGLAQQYNIADANSYPRSEHSDHYELVGVWRTALVKQMLTPAPDVAAVAWKRTQLRGGQYRYTDVKPERLQCAIDADVEWLEAHPSKKSIAASRQAKDRQTKD